MIRFLREFRIIPVVLFATACLFTLKVMGIVLEGGYILGGYSGTSPASPAKVAAAPSVSSDIVSEVPKSLSASANSKQSWAQEMFNYPDVTGSVTESKPAENAPAAKPGAPASTAVNPPAKPDGTLVSLDSGRPASAAERAILERLQERRQEIEARAREMDIRDGMLKAAEKRVEARVAELKDLEARVNAALLKKDDADASRFKGLVSMYENMKAKDAAKIFDRLELPILVQVTSQINPRRMSDILGQMSPEVAERLTVELANRASSTERVPSTAELPKIQGRPSGG